MNALTRCSDIWPKNGITFGDCEELEFVTFGPLYPEADDVVDHRDRRDRTHALESELCRAMAKKYKVLNTVDCLKETDPVMWGLVQAAFAEKFKLLQSG